MQGWSPEYAKLICVSSGVWFAGGRVGGRKERRRDVTKLVGTSLNYANRPKNLREIYNDFLM